MKILHVASFTGNIGDNASHAGLHNILDTLFNDYAIKRLEIRRFYQNYAHTDKCSFNAEFIDYANSYDLLIIGGGGFLDYWIPRSASGTTIDMSPGLVEKLTVPTFIASVGCAPHQKIPDGNINKFRAFLDAALANPKIRIAVRNDGSVNSIKRDIGGHYLDKIPEVLDHGFFYDTNFIPDFVPKGDYIALNITEDQIGMNSNVRGDIDDDLYYGQLSNVCHYITQDMGLPIILVPHIYSDLNAITRLLSYLEDFVIREKIFVAPCIQGATFSDQIFGIYKKSKLVLGTRLHANICSLAMGKSSVGLIALDRVKYVYDFLGKEDSYIYLDKFFAKELCHKISNTISGPNASILPFLNEKKVDNLNIYKNIFSEMGL